MTVSAPRLLRRINVTAITRPAAAEKAQAKSITPMKTSSAGDSSPYSSHVARTKSTTMYGAAEAIDQVHHLNAISACTVGPSSTEVGLVASATVEASSPAVFADIADELDREEIERLAVLAREVQA